MIYGDINNSKTWGVLTACILELSCMFNMRPPLIFSSCSIHVVSKFSSSLIQVWFMLNLCLIHVWFMFGSCSVQHESCPVSCRLCLRDVRSCLYHVQLNLCLIFTSCLNLTMWQAWGKSSNKCHIVVLSADLDINLNRSLIGQYSYQGYLIGTIRLRNGKHGWDGLAFLCRLLWLGVARQRWQRCNFCFAAVAFTHLVILCQSTFFLCHGIHF